MRQIFLVEDNKDDRDLFQLALRHCHISAALTFAHNASEAIVRLNRMGPYSKLPLPDLIVLDMHLPGLDGSKLLEVIRNSMVTKRVAVMVLSAAFLDSDREKCEALGISAFVRKPMTFAGLLELVRQLPVFFPARSDLEARRDRPKTPLPGTF
jgi:two-component system response regulator